MADRSKLAGVMAGLCLVAAGSLGSAQAQTIVDDWASVKAPPAPTLKAVTVDPKTTALLVLDLVNRICNDKKPRCIASLPKVKAFLAQARAHKMPVIYSLVGGTTAKDVDPQVALVGSEPTVTAHADKFLGTNLDKILKDLHVTTVITVGSSAEGAVLYTASHAAFIGYKVIDPVDGSSSGTPYGEVAAAWMLSNAPGVGANTTLTRFDMIGW